MTLLVREMTAADCEAVARVRIRSWQHTYAGLMPRSYLDAMSVEEDAARRREHLVKGGGQVIHLVAERAGRVVGWGCYGTSRDQDAPEEAAELYALYVLPEHLATGVGRTLMDTLTKRAAAERYPLLLLWVLAANTRARRFYAKAGFVADGAEESFTVDGVAVPEVRYARALSASAAAAPSLG
ncbi:GNAT family N-acetyltransferase [Streptomyces sp. AK02-01A]|uniref:GNAT family N-acetyltransferase n=1 Tax=Streptomyces sp. AK02-01A TaxID=3028648 RepID=UPI0029B8B5AB|nr:GNAT family N-acetyltransferase [Streptomyces sp. AK02-01A]MDX3853024.1 GNAT family N-acetyltransferase [Streptomyces sp. AK02-01A]